MIANVIIANIVEQISHDLSTTITSKAAKENDVVSLSPSKLLLISGERELIYKANESELTSGIENILENNDIIFDYQKDIDWDAAKSDILSSLNWRDLRTGEISELETIIHSLINLSSQNETLKWLNDLFIELYGNSLFISTLLHALSHMDYEDVVPNGPTMAMAALSHKDDRVVSYAVKSFYNWNSKETLKFMRDVEPKATWVNLEWKKVIEHLEKYGDD